MPRGRLTKTVSIDGEAQDDSSEYNFQLSQASVSSDDHALELAVAEQYFASREKKKKELQKKFLASGQKLVARELSSVSTEIQSTVQSVEDILGPFLVSASDPVRVAYGEEIRDAFLINYATEQDNIRRIWTEILEEHGKLQTLVQQRIEANQIAGEEREAASIQALTKAKEACFETMNIIRFVDPTAVIAADAVPTPSPSPSHARRSPLAEAYVQE